jgi:peptidoglycan/LPS O-acetylase OafA/YrhL
MHSLSGRAALAVGDRFASLDYRPDIDGLRAVAIVPVLAFHAGLPGWSGGFVGVDVFFVISGYLITSLILGEYARGSFTFWGFVERRARRLAPAMVPVLVATLLAGYFLFLPNAFQELAKSVMMFSAFAANHYFLGESGYFDFHGPAPLLHTWSLSVEEQFYLAFSLTLLGVLRWAPRRLEIVIVTAGLLSFATAVALIEIGQESAAFYLSPSRFWELLIGAWLALGHLPTPSAIAAACCRAAGLLLIAAAVFLYSGNLPFPGPAALVPTVGAALVILAGTAEGEDPAYRLLASRAAVYVGRISYSLYLWHWPLLVFAGIYADVLPDWYRLPVTAFAFVPAALSYRFVERPFRKRAWLPGRGTMLATAVSTTVAFLVAGAWIDYDKGLPLRLPAEVRAALQTDPLLRDPLFESCLSFERGETGTFCELGDTGRQRIDFAVWGDSHAAAERRLFDRLASDFGLRGVLLSAAGCAAHMPFNHPRKHQKCQDYSRRAEAFIAEHDIPVVFLAARWCLYVDFASCLGPVEGVLDGRMVDQSAKRAEFKGLLTATVERLAKAGRRIWLVQPVPEFGWDVPSVAAEALLRGVPTRALELPRDRFVAANALPLEVMDKLDDGVRVREIATMDALCPGDICVPTDPEGRPFYRDSNHLSVRGAALLAPRLEPAFREMQESAWR